MKSRSNNLCLDHHTPHPQLMILDKHIPFLFPYATHIPVQAKTGVLCPGFNGSSKILIPSHNSLLQDLYGLISQVDHVLPTLHGNFTRPDERFNFGNQRIPTQSGQYQHRFTLRHLKDHGNANKPTSNVWDGCMSIKIGVGPRFQLCL